MKIKNYFDNGDDTPGKKPAAKRNGANADKGGLNKTGSAPDKSPAGQPAPSESAQRKDAPAKKVRLKSASNGEAPAPEVPIADVSEVAAATQTVSGEGAADINAPSEGDRDEKAPAPEVPIVDVSEVATPAVPAKSTVNEEPAPEVELKDSEPAPEVPVAEVKAGDASERAAAAEPDDVPGQEPVSEEATADNAQAQDIPNQETESEDAPDMDSQSDAIQNEASQAEDIPDGIDIAADNQDEDFDDEMADDDWSGEFEIRDVKRRGNGGDGGKKIPVAWLIVIDVLAAGLLLFLFSLYYVILPRDMSGNEKPLPRPTVSETPEPTPEPTVSEEAADTETPEPTPTSDGTAWGYKFPGVFTDGEVVQTENSYKSGNISVDIEKVQQEGATYYVADIYIKDYEYFRTAFGRENTFGYIDPTDEIARYVGGVIAINGDFCTKNEGVVVRDGVMHRDKMHDSDLLALNYDGTMQTFSPEEFDLAKIEAEGVWQVWTFGPMLLKDGQPMTRFNSSVVDRNPRSAVGYYEPGHYCFVVVDGRQPGYSMGMTMEELSQLFYDMGCTVAYNMDGGKSAEMAFMGELVNQPYDGGRATSDILYIADNKGGN